MREAILAIDTLAFTIPYTS